MALMRILLLLTAAAALLPAEDSVLTRVAAHADHFGSVSRQIWEWAETGFREQKSAALLRDELRQAGFTIDENVAGIPTAFTATWGSGKPVIGILGEYDALPGLSQQDVPRQAPREPGAPGHGCGHNLLGSASALAAVAVKEEMQARGLKGTLRFYGTPAEEGGDGKVYMLHAGAFRDVDAVLAWHPWDANRANLRSCLAVTAATFRFYGQAAHAAAAPERGRSALDGLMLASHAIELLREHVPQETRMHYIVTNGGSAPNIVPAFSEMSIMARHPDGPTLAAIWSRVLKCAEAGALATETRVETRVTGADNNILPNDALTALVARNLRKAGGYRFTPEEQAFAEQIQKTLPGAAGSPGPDQIFTEASEGADAYSTDVGDVSWNVPTVQFNTAAFVPGTPAHSWQSAACAGTSIGRKGLVVAARTLALSAVDLLTDPQQVAAARAAFEKRRAGRAWTSLIPAGSKPPVSTP